MPTNPPPLMTPLHQSLEGIALLDKPPGKTSFYLVSFLRRLTNVRRIGHAGTLDPFATGVMILLVGKRYTKLSETLMKQDKEYVTRLKLGETTDSYDKDGALLTTSTIIPSIDEVRQAIAQMQGNLQQTPPMFSAKKVNGQKLYTLARQGKVIERQPKEITICTTLLDYQYPYIDLHIACTSGTYIRSIGHDIGEMLGCGAHLVELQRTKVGPFHLQECQKCDELLASSQLNLRPYP